MIEYFKHNIEQLQSRDISNFKIKYTIFSDEYYHKFVAGDYTKDFLQQGYLEKLVIAINKHCDNLIEDYYAWPDIGAVYLKCRKVEFYYDFNSEELISQFPSLEEYLDYVLEKIINFSRDIYPSHFNDWLKGNIAVQSDLSWIIVDLDDMLEYRPHLQKHDVIELLQYKVAREGGYIDAVKAKDYITKYFKDHPDALDFITG